MSKPNAATSANDSWTDKAVRFVRAVVDRSLWLIVLVPILAVSGYSLWFVARHLGVPMVFAVAMSTCFDGVALIAAKYSVRYAQAGLSGSGPRTVVRLFAVLAAYLQTLHARIGNEPPGAWVLWAALPISAVVVYDIHIRWERRQALAKSGQIYPAPLPAFGFSTWFFFLPSSVTALRTIVERRRNAIVENADRRAKVVKPKETKDNAKDPVNDAPKEPARPRPSAPLRVAGSSHTPTLHIREWWAETGREPKLGDRGRVPGWIVEEYEQGHRTEAEG